MNINITLAKALDRASEGLRKKMLHSVELLQKAEKIALNYDAENGYYLAFSGGKDSQALFHMTQLAGVKFCGHMNLTSVDPPEVIRFVKRNYPEVELIKPGKSIFQHAIEKQILPTMRVRWCCAEYKETAGSGKVTLIGIRKAESSRRAKRNEVEINNRKFSGDLDGLDEYRQEQRAKHARRKSKEQGVNITNADEEQTLGCIHGKESLLISPIIHWTEKDVWEFLNDVVRVPHCSLYDEGWHRIGCIGCPMSTAKQKIVENKRWPHVKRNWIKAIKAIRAIPTAGGGLSEIRIQEKSLQRTGFKHPLNSYQKDIWRAIPKERMERNVDANHRCGGGIQKRIYLVEHPQGLDASQKRQRIAQDAGGYRSETLDPARFYKQSDWNGNKRRNTGIQSLAMHGFSDSSSSDRLTEEQENEIAENIYDWWISGKSYKQWYAEKFQQLKLDFGEF